MAFVQAPYGFDITVGFPADKRYVIDSGNPWDSGNVSQYSAYEGILVYSKSLDTIHMFTGAISATDFDANKTALEDEDNWIDLTATRLSGDTLRISTDDPQGLYVNRHHEYAGSAAWTEPHEFGKGIILDDRDETKTEVYGELWYDPAAGAQVLKYRDGDGDEAGEEQIIASRAWVEDQNFDGIESLTADPTGDDLTEGLVWYRSDLDELRFRTDETEVVATESYVREHADDAIEHLGNYEPITNPDQNFTLDADHNINFSENTFGARTNGNFVIQFSSDEARDAALVDAQWDDLAGSEVYFRFTNQDDPFSLQSVYVITVVESGGLNSFVFGSAYEHIDGPDILALNASQDGDNFKIESRSSTFHLREFDTNFHGLVPRPSSSDVTNNRVLQADGDWVDQTTEFQVLQDVRTDGGNLQRDVDGDIVGTNLVNLSSSGNLQIAYDDVDAYRVSAWTNIEAGDRIRITNGDRSQWGVYTANGAGSNAFETLSIAGGITLVAGDDVFGDAEEADVLIVEIYVDNGDVIGTFTDDDAGLVPAPLSSGDENKFLKGDGGWETPTDTTYTAGTNIEIDDDNVISSTDTTYTAGDGISIDTENDNAISIDLEDNLSGLEITDSGLGIDLDADGGLAVVTDGLTLTLNGTTLTKNSSGVRVNYDHSFIGNTAWSRMHLKDNTNTSDPQSLVTREDLNNHTFVTPVVHSGDPNTLANLETDTSSTITWTTNDTSGTSFSGNGARAWFFQPTELGNNDIAIGDGEDFSVYTNTSSNVVDSTNSTVIRVVGENAVLNDSSDFTIPTYLSINTLEPVETYIEIRRRPAANVNWGNGTSVSASPTVGTPIFRSQIIDVTNGTYTRDYTMSLVGGQTANFDKDDMLIVNFVITSTNGSNTVGNSIFSFGALDNSDHSWSLDFTTHHYDDIFEFETGGDVRIRINDGDGNFDNKKIYDATNDLILGLPRAPEDEATYDLVVNSDGDPSWTERSDDLTVENLTVNQVSTLNGDVNMYGDTQIGSSDANDTLDVQAFTTFDNNNGVIIKETVASAELELYADQQFNSFLNGYQTGVGGWIEFHAKNSEGDKVRYATITGTSVQNTDDSEEGALQFYLRDPNNASNSSSDIATVEKFAIKYNQIESKEKLILESVADGDTSDSLISITDDGELQKVPYPSLDGGGIDKYSDSSTYSLNDVVWFDDDDTIYVWNSSTDSVAGNSPSDDTTNWLPLSDSDQFDALSDFITFVNNDTGVSNTLSIANLNTLANVPDTASIITDQTFTLSGNAGKAVVVSSDQTQLTLSGGIAVDSEGDGINGTPTGDQVVAWDSTNSRLYWKDDGGSSTSLTEVNSYENASLTQEAFTIKPDFHDLFSDKTFGLGTSGDLTYQTGTAPANDAAFDANYFATRWANLPDGTVIRFRKEDNSQVAYYSFDNFHKNNSLGLLQADDPVHVDGEQIFVDDADYDGKWFMEMPTEINAHVKTVSGDGVDVSESGRVSIDVAHSNTWTAAQSFDGDVTLGNSTINNMSSAAAADVLDVTGSAIADHITMYDTSYNEIRTYVNRAESALTNGVDIHKFTVNSTYEDGDVYQSDGYPFYTHDVRYGESSGDGRAISEWSVYNAAEGEYTSILLDQDEFGLYNVTDDAVPIYTAHWHVSRGEGMLIPSRAGDVGSPGLGRVWFNTTTGQFRARTGLSGSESTITLGDAPNWNDGVNDADLTNFDTVVAGDNVNFLVSPDQELTISSDQFDPQAWSFNDVSSDDTSKQAKLNFQAFEYMEPAAAFNGITADNRLYYTTELPDTDGFSSGDLGRVIRMSGAPNTSQAGFAVKVIHYNTNRDKSHEYLFWIEINDDIQNESDFNSSAFAAIFNSTAARNEVWAIGDDSNRTPVGNGIDGGNQINAGDWTGFDLDSLISNSDRNVRLMGIKVFEYDSEDNIDNVIYKGRTV